MSDAGFEKVSPSDKPMYGPRKLMVCGFPSDPIIGGRVAR